MIMSRIKEKVIEFVKRLPESATIDDIVNALEEKKEIVKNMNHGSANASFNRDTLPELASMNDQAMDKDLISKKTPLITISEALAEQTNFIKRQREKERKYRLAVEDLTVDEI